MSWLDIDDDLKDLLFRIKVKVGGRVVDKDFVPDIEVDVDNLTEELSKIPATFAFWSMVLAEQTLNKNVSERKYKRVRAQARDKLLKEARNEGYSLKIGDLDELVDGTDEVTRAHAELMVQDRILSKVFGIRDALRIKADVLRSLAAQKRQELMNMM